MNESMKKSTASSSLPKLSIEAEKESHDLSDDGFINMSQGQASQVPEIITDLTQKRSILKSNLRAYEADPVKLTPGLDPTQLNSDAKEVGGRSVRFSSTDHIFRASEDDQIIRRGIDQLHFVLPLNSPLLKPAITENPTTDLNRFQSTPPLTAAVQSAGAPAMNSPYTRMCDLLEHFVDAETEATDEMLFNRPLMSERNGSVDLSPELDNALLSNNTAVINVMANNNAANATTSSMSESRSLWLGNVDPTVTEEEIRHVFSPFGVIETIRLLPAKECAFVNYYDLDSAIRGRNAMQGKPLGNMILRIGFGKISDSATTSGIGINSNAIFNASSMNASQAAGSNLQSRSVWIGNVGPEITADLLMYHFNAFGPIESCRVLEAKNCAFVNYYNAEAAAIAKQKMNGALIGESLIKTGHAKDTNNNNAVNTSSTNNNNTNNGSNGVYNSNAYPYNNSALNNEPILSIMKKSGKESTTGGAGKPAVMTFASIIADEDEPEDEISSDNNNNTCSSIFDGVQLREFRRAVEGNPEEIPKILEALMSQGSLGDLSIDSYGNILLQKMLERAQPGEQENILKALHGQLAEISMHKNGTWVVQKLITTARREEIRVEAVEELKEKTVELIEDQFGNYVIQCILRRDIGGNIMNININTGSSINTNDGVQSFETGIAFIVERIVQNCKRLALGKYSSRALRSILDSSTMERQKLLASALAKESVLLSVDPNGAVVIQWILDSELPGKVALVTGQLQGRLSQVALTKQGGVIVARIIASPEEPKYRDAAILELYELPSEDKLVTNTTNNNNNPKDNINSNDTKNYTNSSINAGDYFTKGSSSSLDSLLNEPATCSILYKAFQVSKPAIRLRLSRKLRPKLIKLIQDLLGREDVENFTDEQVEKFLPVHLTKLYQEFIKT